MKKKAHECWGSKVECSSENEVQNFPFPRVCVLGEQKKRVVFTRCWRTNKSRDFVAGQCKWVFETPFEHCVGFGRFFSINLTQASESRKWPTQPATTTTTTIVDYNFSATWWRDGWIESRHRQFQMCIKASQHVWLIDQVQKHSHL